MTASGAKRAYAQARMQARHGARLDPEAWRRLEATRSAARLIELARTTALAPWAARVSAEMDPHALERGLRAGWRATAEETARWAPAPWRAGVLLFCEIPELPLREARQGAAPAWIAADPRLAAATKRAGPRWRARWRAAWLGEGGAAAIERLGARFFGHLDQLEPRAPARAPRAELEAESLRVFRRCAGAKAAALAYLCLALLDFERFRGLLLERAVFGTDREIPA